MRVFVRGAVAWREAPAWPLPDAEPTAFHLRSHGRANGRTGDGALAREAPAGRGARRRLRLRSARSRCSPTTTRRSVATTCSATRRQRLSAPITLGGPVRAVLFAASSAAVTDFNATLVALAADGTPHSAVRRACCAAGALPARPAGSSSIWGPPARASRRASACVSPSRPPRFRAGTGRHTRMWNPASRGENELAVAAQTLFHDRERPSHVWLPLLRS